MKKLTIGVTSGIILTAAFASAAGATEGDYRNSALPIQGLSLHLETEHALRASTAAEMQDLQLAFVRKQTQRDDRKIGDE